MCSYMYLYIYADVYLLDLYVLTYSFFLLPTYFYMGLH